MIKHTQKITAIVCLLLLTLMPSLQAAEEAKGYKVNEPKAPIAWFEAAKAGNKKELAELYNKHNIDIEAQDGHYKATALHLSAREGHLEVVKYLCQQGADIEAKTDKSNGISLMNTPHTNNYYNSAYNTSEVKVLPNGYTALHLSAENGHLEVVKYLCQQGTDIEAKTDKSNGISLMNKQHSHHNFRSYHPSEVKVLPNGYTALHLSAENGHLEVVKYLCQQGTDIDAQDGCFKSTALHLSAENGQLEVVKYLVQQGADTGAKNSVSKTPLDTAREKDLREVKIFLENPTKCIREYFKEEMQQQKIAFETHERELIESHRQREANLRAEHQNELMQREIAFNDETEARVAALTESHRQREANLRTEHENELIQREIAFNNEVERRVTELESTLKAEHQATMQKQKTAFEAREIESQRKEKLCMSAICLGLAIYIATYYGANCLIF